MQNLNHIAVYGLLAVVLAGCSQSTTTDNTKVSSDVLAGCYTISKSEPAQIKINQAGDSYTMQMRQFNDPNKDWDNPEPMEVLANNDNSLSKYFDIQANESKYLEKVIARPDRVFVLAKISSGFASLNPQFDSPYLGYIYKGSNTVYKVSCENTKTA